MRTRSASRAASTNLTNLPTEVLQHIASLTKSHFAHSCDFLHWQMGLRSTCKTFSSIFSPPVTIHINQTQDLTLSPKLASAWAHLSKAHIHLPFNAPLTYTLRQLSQALSYWPHLKCISAAMNGSIVPLIAKQCSKVRELHLYIYSTAFVSTYKAKNVVVQREHYRACLRTLKTCKYLETLHLQWTPPAFCIGGWFEKSHCQLLGKLTQLHTLSLDCIIEDDAVLPPLTAALGQLAKLTNLTVFLQFDRPSSVDDLQFNLAPLTDLKSMKLSAIAPMYRPSFTVSPTNLTPHLTKLELIDTTCLPSVLQPLHELVELHMDCSFLSDLHTQALSQATSLSYILAGGLHLAQDSSITLPSMKHLRLKGPWHCAVNLSQILPSLEFLEISSIGNAYWESSMNLRCLSNHPKLTHLRMEFIRWAWLRPDSLQALQSMPSLRTLCIELSDNDEFVDDTDSDTDDEDFPAPAPQLPTWFQLPRVNELSMVCRYKLHLPEDNVVQRLASLVAALPNMQVLHVPDTFEQEGITFPEGGYRLDKVQWTGLDEDYCPFDC